MTIGFFIWISSLMTGNLRFDDSPEQTTMTANFCFEVIGVGLDPDQRHLLIEWQDSHHSVFPYIWLRHERFFPLMGRPEQRQDSEFSLPEDPASLAIESTRIDHEHLMIDWAHDGSVTRHSLPFLRENCLSAEARQQRHPRPRLWDARRAQAFPWFEGSDFEEPYRRLELLLHLRDYGIALVRNLSDQPGTVEVIARHVGPVRNTHFGSLFDIRSLPEDQQGTGANIGATSCNAIAPHADEGWRHAPPGISLMHCLRADPSGGGVSVFVDGIAAAETLRTSDPEAFQFLSSVPLSFAAERNPRERFRSHARVIATDREGVVRGIRINDRTQSQPDLDVEMIEPAYHALRKLYAIILSLENNFEHLLQPGEMVIFDNHRVLHARRSFDPTAGERWIQQLSIDREEFQNLFRQLAESCDRDDLSAWDQDAGALSQD
jgi:gamma-butyrobetaine dioxygenase